MRIGYTLSMIELIENIAQNIWAVYLDTAIWLLLGLLAAGLVKVFIPESAMKKWLGGSGFPAVSRAALFGAPLPLCSCGVLPAAIGLRRAGASKEATVSFLISTPETSIDSVAVTYALIGPVMAIYRPIAALFSAIITGMMVTLVNDEHIAPADAVNNKETCSGNNNAESSCCATNNNDSTKPENNRKNNKLMQALRYAGADLLDDISKWMAVGIIFAGLMMALIPDGWLAQWGQGFLAMLVMLLVGIPLYICAVASTPVAAGLLVAGVSPGAVLVFLLVGPATNIGGLMLIKQELGKQVTLIYLAGISMVSLIMGYLLDWGISVYDWQIDARHQQHNTILPEALSLAAAILLLLLAVPKIRNNLLPFFRDA